MLATAWAAGEVCKINGTPYATLDAALAAVTDGQTITLLAPIDYNQGISITDGRNIIFNLNGFNLNVTNSGGVGLTVTSGSVGYTGAGAFNVSGASFGLNVNGSSASATVTNVTATYPGSYGASASNGGSIIINGDVEGGFAGAHAFTANSTVVVSGDATGNDANSYGAYAQGGTITIGGKAQGASCGVSANGSSASATVTNATATAEGGNGAVAINGGSIVVNGNAQGGYNGVYVANPGSTAVINGNATGTASDSSGASVGFGGSVTINGGTAQGVMHGAYANGDGSLITVNDGNAIGTGPYSHGAHAEIDGSIHIDGDVRGTQYGVVSGTDTSVVVTGNVTVTAALNGWGVHAERGGRIEVGGNVVANGSSLGALATYSEITIDGAILATNYIKVYDHSAEAFVYKDGSAGSRTIPTTKDGYFTYSAGTSTVWVKEAAPADTTPPVWTSGYPFTNYVQDDELGLAVSADETCTVYYVVLADGAVAPSAEQVQNRQDAGGNTVPGNSFTYSNPPTSVAHYVGGLTPETAYDIYVVLKDVAGNLQVEPARIDVTTLSYFDTIPNDTNSEITDQEQGAAGSKQVTLTVTVRNAAGEAITGIGPGNFEVSIDGSALHFVNNPPFSGFTDNGDGTYTVVFTGDADDTEYSFTNLTVYGVVIEAGPTTVTTPPAVPEPDTTPPSVPTSLEVTDRTTSSITIAWDASTDAGGIACYEIQMKQGSSGTYSIVGSTGGDETGFTKTGLSTSATYYFQVRAKDESTNVSDWSAEISATTRSSGGSSSNPAPAAPLNLRLVANEGQIEFAWDKNTESDLAGYNIYRRVKGKSGDAAKLNTELIKNASFTDISATAGETYIYYIVAVDNAGNKSDKSNEVEVTLAPVSSRKVFSDVAASSWYAPFVAKLDAHNIASGYADGTFRPNEKVTRAEFTKMIVLAMGWEVETPTATSFPDVAEGGWAHAYAECGKAHGVLDGYMDGSFRPNNPIKREEAAKIVARTLNLPDGASSLKDVNSSWAKGFINSCVTAGIIDGYPQDSTFRPKNNTTRAEASAMIARMLKD